ncbi:MAG: peptidylprolyl isomerase [Desulfobacteraceae bacterium]
MNLYHDIHKSLVAVVLIGLMLPMTTMAAAVPPSGKAADVNGKTILYTDFERQVSMFKRQVMKGQAGQLPDALMQRLRDQVIQKMIGDELLYQQAVTKGITIEDKTVDNEMIRIRGQFKDENQYQAQLKASGHTEEALREQIRRQATISQLIRKEIVPTVDVKPEDAKKYYENNSDKFRRPERVRAQHILMKTDQDDSKEKKAEARKKLKDLHKRILAGEDFGTLAKEHSQGPSSARGGDLGYFTRGRMVKAFEEVAFKLAPNEVSDIVETRFGYHLIKVLDHQPESNPKYEDIEPRIMSILFKEQVQKKLEPYVLNLREKAKVEIYIK